MSDTNLHDAVFYVPRETLLNWIDQADEYHRERLGQWSDDVDKLEASIPDNLSIDAFNHSGGRGVAASIDPTLQRELQTAMGRAKFHQNKCNFLANVRVLIEADEGKSTVPMTVRDVEDFFAWRKVDEDTDRS